MYDVIVVGAGPAGLYAASLYEKLGIKVAILEEHACVGKPKHCSGLISWNIGRFLKLPCDVIENEVSVARLHVNSKTIRLRKNRKAFVIDREKFDKYLASMLDTKIFFKNKAKGVEIKKDRVGIVTDKGTMKARVVVGADGANSIIARAINSKLRFKLGIIAIKRERDNGKAVDLYFRKDLVRDGFLWHIPRGNAREYGMFGSNANYSMLEKFFGIKKYKRFGGLMPAGYRKTYADRILLIGDAASQTKPWSGGGVIYSLACAKLSAYILKRAFDKEDFSSGMLRLYEVLWKRLIGWQIKAGMLFWDAYSMAPTSCMRAAFLFIKGLQHALDMDFIKS